MIPESLDLKVQLKVLTEKPGGKTNIHPFFSHPTSLCRLKAASHAPKYSGSNSVQHATSEHALVIKIV